MISVFSTTVLHPPSTLKCNLERTNVSRIATALRQHVYGSKTHLHRDSYSKEGDCIGWVTERWAKPYGYGENL
jgi:hypothetical protein